jgi:alpha-1,2-mannosyltransferase
MALGAVALLGWVPLWEHVEHGQTGLLLLWLVVLGWRALRHGRDVAGGAAIGIATAIKLYPGLIILQLALARRWRACAAAIATGAAFAAVTTALTGIDAWRRYLLYGAPELQHWVSHWGNASITGFVARLFLPDATCIPIATNVPVADALLALGLVAVVGALAWTVLRRPADVDRGLSLALTASVLVSAVAWQHYFVVLLLPLAVCVPEARTLGRRWIASLALAWLLMDVPQHRLATALLGPGPASPLASLTFVSVGFWGLSLFFVWQALAWRRDQRTTTVFTFTNSRSPHSASSRP